jgi:hypothetical protein
LISNFWIFLKSKKGKKRINTEKKAKNIKHKTKTECAGPSWTPAQQIRPVPQRVA